MSRPRILLDAMSVDARPTGVGNSIIDLLEAMSASDRGLDFLIATRNATAFDFCRDRPGWRILESFSSGFTGLDRLRWLWRILPRLAREQGADLVHALTFPAPESLNVPLVLTIHDVAFRLHPDTIGRRRRIWYDLQVPRSIRRADLILTNSLNTATELCEQYPAACGKTETTLFGAPRWLAPADAPRVPRPGAPFLFVGLLEPRKNLMMIMEAYQGFRDALRLRGHTGDVPLLKVVGGAGWKCSDIRHRLEDLCSQGYAQWTGYQTRSELAKTYASAHCLLFPSRHEGFGFPILEAMRSGLPVITSDRGAMREIAGDAAILVDPDSVDSLMAAMLDVTLDLELRKRMSSKGLARQSRFNWEKTADGTVNAYFRVLHRTSDAI